MKFLFLILIGLSFEALAFDCSPRSLIEWKSVAKGLYWAKYDLAFTAYDKDLRRWSTERNRNATVRAFKINLSLNKLLLHTAPQSLSCTPGRDRYITQLIKDQNLNALAAINASFFVMPNGGILGLALDENKLWSGNLENLNKVSAGVFTISDKAVNLVPKKEFVTQHGTIFTQAQAAQFQFAIEAYPQLLNGGELLIDDSVLNSRRARTSIGKALDSNEIILVTIDARGETNETGATLFEYAHMLKTEACGVSQSIALNLDGGGSSAFAIPSQDIAEQAEDCRNLGNILTIHPLK